MASDSNRTDLTKLAIADTAAWCSFVGSDLHGVQLFSGKLPDDYPNFVTLDAREARLQQDRQIDALDRLNVHGDAGIKDSHAGLDLTHRGFTALKGQRIGLEAGQGASVVTDHAVHRARDAATIRAWMQAAGVVAFEAGALLAHPSRANKVALLSICDGTQIIAGAICTTFGAGIGISNVFGAADDIPVWPPVVRAARRRFGDRPLVGWEFEADLDAPILAGLRQLHAMQVWIRAAAPSNSRSAE